MAGIYIHIPFCRTKCDYCNFFSLASQRNRDEYAMAVCLEIEQRAEYLGNAQISTIYFGGGTPSLLSLPDIERILNQINKTFIVSSNPEITLEANPDDLTTKKPTQYRELGINRLSIGIQSFFDEDLHYLNRLHNPFQARKAIDNSINAGFSNLSIDLIFGLPTQSISRLEANLSVFREYDISHLSAYTLTVEPNTALAWKIKKNKIQAVSDEEQADQFLFLMKWTKDQGFLQYELSNYCLPGFESKHNSSYWNGEKYIGIGPSAHSYDGFSRQWNVAGLKKYLEGVNSGIPFFEKEILSRIQIHNEYIMTALRTGDGIKLGDYEKKFGSDFFKELLTVSQEFIAREWVVNKSGNLFLTRQGKLFADSIVAELFLDNIGFSK